MAQTSIDKSINLYTYRVTWSEEDKEFLGLCAEFPSLSWLAETPEAALKGIIEVVTEVVDDMKEASEAIPEPLLTKQFSGKFMVRVLPELHRQLAIEAAEAGVSLNRLVSSRLSGTSYRIPTKQKMNITTEETVKLDLEKSYVDIKKAHAKIMSALQKYQKDRAAELEEAK